MKSLRFLGILAFVLLSSHCQKKSESARNEIHEAGYELTTNGWFKAVEAGDITVLRKMVSTGFDEKVKDAEGNSALHTAATKGNQSVGEYLLNRGFSIDELGASGQTPLMAAVLADQPKMVKWLLSQGADPAIKDENGFTSLMLAVTEGKKSSVEELAPYHRKELDDALLVAALVGQAEIIDTLTSYGASVYARMEDGRTSLMLAAQNGHEDAVVLLMDIGASRFATTEDGQTAQSFAIAAGNDEIAKIIEIGFADDALALESDEEVAQAMDEFLEEIQASSPQEDVSLAENSDPGSITSNASPTASSDQAVFPQNGSTAATNQASTHIAPRPLAGAIVSPKAYAGGAATNAEQPPLIMRHYRQRELPVEIKKVSGGVASLRLAGQNSRNIQVTSGEMIPGSTLMVARVYSRTETGKLNNGQPFEVGIVEVEDNVSGQQAEWIAGKSAPAHEPVALVEDAITGQRYLAKPGQTFSSEDGREFVVSDIRPSQLVIEETATGQVSTLRLRGPKG